jgi:rare lipoprotein A
MAGAISTPRVLRGSALALLLSGALTACATTHEQTPLADAGHLHGTDKPYQINGQWYYPKADPHYDEVGLASWYGYPFRNRRTANGEIFDQNLISAAHRTLPLPCIVEVTNLQNGRRVRVRVNDRGPFVDGRLIDLSKAAAAQLGFDRQGVTRVRVRYISAAEPLPAPGWMQASTAGSGAAYGGNAYRPAPSYTAAPPTSADGFDSIEQAQPDGRIQPAPEPIAQDPLAANDAVTPVASWSSNAPISSAALPALSDTPPPAPPASGGFAVQAGAFASRPAADRAAERLATAGQTSVLPIQRNGATLYRVTVGAFPDPGAAARARERVIDSGFSDAKVVQSF